MKKSILLTLFLTLTPACYTSRSIQMPRQERAITCKLEDLCDTEISEKELNLQVYISNSEKLWDYRDYREELFGYVKEFFQNQAVNCNILYSNSNFKNFKSPNEIGVEILDSDNSLIKRYFELCPVTDGGEKNRKIKNLRATKGSAVTKAGVALINGGWEEFRSLPRKEIEKKFSSIYEGVSVKEYLLRQNAANICHEVLHCFGLFHPNTFHPDFVSEQEEGVPNIMSYGNPKFTKENKTGYRLTDFQKKFVHSFLSGNNSYRAFLASNKDLDAFATRIALENKLRLTNPVIVINNWP